MKKPVLFALGLLAVSALLVAGVGHAADLHPFVQNTALTADTFMAMAVVAKYGTGARDPASVTNKAIDAIFAQAKVRCLVSQIAVANGDSAASVYSFGDIPSDTILDPSSLFWFAGLTGVVDFDIGLRYPNGGAVILADCIVNGHDIHAAGSTTLAAATGSGVATAANQLKRAWELAGLAKDPGGNLTVYGTANAASTAAGVANLILRYFHGA
jgi:hypothetical protein